MSKNIKLIAGAGLAVAAASMASVSNSSALGFADIVTEFTDNGKEIVTISASDPDADYRNIDGSLNFVNGYADITAKKVRGAVTDVYININGTATLDAGFSSVANTGVKIHVTNNGTLAINSTAVIATRTELVNNGTINIASTPTINGTLTNKGTINATAAFDVAGVLDNTGIINVYNTSTIDGRVANSGTINIAHNATMTVSNSGMLQSTGTVSVLGTLNLPADTARATGNYTLVVRTAEGGSVAGTVNSASGVDIASRIIVPQNIEGVGTDGIKSITFKFKLDKTKNATGYHYTVEIREHAGNKVEVFTTDNARPADATVTIKNDNTKLHDYIREAFDHNQSVNDFLVAAGINIEDLTEADMAYLVSQANIYAPVDPASPQGYKYNYFEGWYSDAHYNHLANLEAKVKDDETIFAYLSVRNRLFVGIGTKDEMLNWYDPDDFDNAIQWGRAMSKYMIYAKQGQKYGDIKPQIVAMLTAYNKAHGTNYGVSDILVRVDRVNYPHLNTTLIDGQRYVRLDNVLGLEVDDGDLVYILVGKNAVKPAAATSTKPGAGATLASVKAPSTGAISEAAGSASSSNIFAVVAGAIVALGAAVAKLFKKSER